jgi:hypothetical protein
MNPMYYGAVVFLSFVTPLFALALWMLHGLRKNEAEKREANAATSTAAPESRSQSAE